MRNASIDVAAAKERGIVVCGTPAVGSPTSGIAIGLMLELTRRIGYENTRMKAGMPWQTTIRARPRGADARRARAGQLGTPNREIAQAFGMKVVAWSQNLTPEKCKRDRRRLRRQGGSLPPSGLPHDPRGHLATHARPRRREGTRPDEANGLYRQHVARADHRRADAAGGATRRRRSRAPGSTYSTSSRCPSIIRCAKWTTWCSRRHLGYVAMQNYRAYFAGVGRRHPDFPRWQPAG